MTDHDISLSNAQCDVPTMVVAVIQIKNRYICRFYPRCDDVQNKRQSALIKHFENCTFKSTFLSWFVRNIQILATVLDKSRLWRYYFSVFLQCKSHLLWGTIVNDV